MQVICAGLFTFSLFLLFGMPIMLALCRLFSFSGILFPHFLFLACRLCLLYAGFSPSSASFFSIFSFWHADLACSMPAFLLLRHPFSLFSLFGMPISLALCRLFSFSGILFPHFLFLACRSRLLYPGFSLSPASFFSIFSFLHADLACSMPAFLLHRHPFSPFSLFGMPISLALCRLFSFTGILFLYFLFLACRSCLLYAGFSPSPASFLSIFSFWHADHACSMPAFLLLRHPFSLFSLFSMPISLDLSRLFSFTGILFFYFLFLACRSRLIYVGFSPSPASFFLIFSFWHADHACSMPAFLLLRHPFSSFFLFSMPTMLALCRLCLIEASFSRSPACLFFISYFYSIFTRHNLYTKSY